MPWLDSITALAGIATAIGVGVASYQILLSRRQAVTQFEDDLTKQFRDIIRRIPVDAMFGKPLPPEELQNSLEAFYRYFDLTNQQVFLRSCGRVSEATWDNWHEGIRSYLARPAFAETWEIIKSKARYDFDELKQLERDGFTHDPIMWKKRPDLLHRTAPPRTASHDATLL